MLNKDINEYDTLQELNELLDSDIADLVKDLDSNDGKYDGVVKTSIINEWRLSNGLAPDEFNSDVIPFIDAIKYIANVQATELNNPSLRPE